MLTVTTFDPGGKRDTAEADDPESALVAGRALWDDAVGDNAVQGYRASVGFYVDGSLVRLVEGRP